MSYALGIELANEAVRVASMSSAASLDAAIDEHPPMLYCEGGSTWAGRDALEHGAGKTQGFVNDIVAGFTVDRLFLTAGRLLTPDQALRELVWGIACRPARERQEWPEAVTVTFPVGWDAAALARAEAVVMGLGLQRPRLLTDVEAASAAADAFARVPTSAPPPPAPDLTLPDLQTVVARRPQPVSAPINTVRHQTEIRSPKVAILVSVGVILALIAILGVVVLLNRSAPSPSPTTAPVGSVVVPTR